MNINDIPPELLLHVFRFLPHQELVWTIDKVCMLWKQLVFTPSLWKVVEYSSAVNVFDHLQEVKDFVLDLTITPGHVINIFGFNQRIQFNNLKSLAFSGNLIVSEEFFNNIIRRCPNLEGLKIIGDNRFNFEHCLNKLQVLKLVSVDIGYFYGTQNLDDKLIEFLGTQPYLRKLTLRGWQSLKDRTISLILKDFPNLTSLYISNDNISDEAFTEYRDATNLTELSIHCPLLTDNGLSIIAQRCTALTNLNIELCREITNQGLKAVTRHCRQIKIISFGNINPNHCKEITNEGVDSIAQFSSYLKSLSTKGCKNVCDDGVIAITKSCKQLTFLSLNGCTELQDRSLFSIAENCHNLKHASFSNCFKITANGALSVVKKCKRLENLILAFCTGIRDTNMHTSEHPQIFDPISEDYTDHLTFRGSHVKTLDCHTHLRQLNLRSCENITTTTVLALVSHCPDLRTLSLLGTLKQHIDDELFLAKVFSLCQFLKKFSIYHITAYKKNAMSIKWWE